MWIEFERCFVNLKYVERLSVAVTYGDFGKKLFHVSAVHDRRTLQVSPKRENEEAAYADLERIVKVVRKDEKVIDFYSIQILPDLYAQILTAAKASNTTPAQFVVRALHESLNPMTAVGYPISPKKVSQAVRDFIDSQNASVSPLDSGNQVLHPIIDTPIGKLPPDWPDSEGGEE